MSGKKCGCKECVNFARLNVAFFSLEFSTQNVLNYRYRGSVVLEDAFRIIGEGESLCNILL